MKEVEVIVIGYSGHAFVVCDVLKKNGYTIKGYCDMEQKENNPYGLEYLGSEKDYNFTDEKVIIAIGHNGLRSRIVDNLGPIGLSLNIVHPTAVIGEHCEIGAGVSFFAGAVVNPMASIGKGTIINTGAIVEHECKIGAFVHVAPGAVLAGAAEVGDRSFVGANSVVIQGVKIGKDVTIGAGSVVLKDVPDGATIVGNPAKQI